MRMTDDEYKTLYRISWKQGKSEVEQIAFLSQQDLDHLRSLAGQIKLRNPKFVFQFAPVDVLSNLEAYVCLQEDLETEK